MTSSFSIPKTLFYCLIIVLTFSCKKNTKDTFAEYKPKTLKNGVTLQKASTPQTQEFKDYWYAGNAEISSFKLSQSRYGELREGTSVLIYVTEPFLKKEQVKADQNKHDNVPVLKLNTTKKFITGVYPYSIMQSTYYPVLNNQHALKVSCSVQEWCGHVYAQLNNKEQFNIQSHSYFEGEADQNFKTEKAYLENQIWTQLRIDPKSLPTGNFTAIPSLEYTKLYHKEIKPYNASAELIANTYSINFPEIKHKLSITFNPIFPHDILSWEETNNGKTTKATKLKTIKSDYWNKKSLANVELRKTLQLNEHY